MRDRLRAILSELEDMDHQIQQGCVDRMILQHLEGSDDTSPDDLMGRFHEQTCIAHAAVENLYDMTKEEK